MALPRSVERSEHKQQRACAHQELGAQCHGLEFWLTACARELLADVPATDPDESPLPPQAASRPHTSKPANAWRSAQGTACRAFSMSAERARVVVEKTVCCLRCKVMLLSNDRMGDVSGIRHRMAAHVPAIRPRFPAATIRCMDDAPLQSRLWLAAALNLSMDLFSLVLLGKSARAPMQAGHGQAEK